MSAQGLLIILSLGVLAWALINELRIKALKSKIIVSEEKNQDAEIVERVHDLSDADLDAKMSDYLGRLEKLKPKP